MKLHIGCGAKYLRGYKHVDLMEHPHIDFLTSADDLSMIEDNTIEEIYACHVLEHFKRHEIDKALKEWNRGVKSGGGVRIAVPDFEALASLYLEDKNSLGKIMGLLYGGQNYEYNFHYQAFDFNRIKELLNNNGFYDVQRYDWRDFLPEGFDDFSRAYLPYMDFENGRLMSLNVVAKKE